MRLWRVFLLVTLIPFIGPRASLAQAGCADPARAADAPNADLYCIDLVAAPDYHGASGNVEMGWARSPFGVAVSPDGNHLYDLTVTVAGLPDFAGPDDRYVVWATTPSLRPMVMLGEVAAGQTATGRVGFDKFLILISLESSPSVIERTGPLVLRGTSPSMRMMPHEGEPMLLVGASSRLSGAAEGEHLHNGADVDGPEGERRDAHGDHADGTIGWIVPPAHPEVPMPPGMDHSPPDALPFLPDAGTGAAAARIARPGGVVRLTDGATLDLEAAPVMRTINGRTFTMYGFNGQYPGPLIQVPQGATIVVNFTNNTEHPTAVHWHGIRLDNRFDGVPHVTQEPVLPGGSFQYRVHFPDAGIYWYHPHHREDIQQDLGLYGNLRVDSPRPDFYSPVNREETLMIDDILIADEGLVPYGLETATHALNGRFGNVFLINGEPSYELAVKRGSVVRFLLTNVANTRTFNLHIEGARMKVVGSDISRFEREEWVESVVIAPAERYIVEAMFDEPGDFAITNRVRGIDHIYGNFFTEVDTLGWARVGDDAADRDFSAAFERLRENADVRADIDRYREHFNRPVDHTLVLALETDGLPFPVETMMRMDSAYFNPVEWTGTMPMMNWVSTGKEVEWIVRDGDTGRENMEIDWRFRVGDVVKMRLINDREAFHAMQHPIHIHGQRFLILSQNGVANDNMVWKDTMLLPVGATADILLELSNPGKWMLHCHIAEHLEAGMKMVFVVD
jgi:FtsP/CotA-like multicopper oxidase with cupredoxin domain